MSKLDMLVIQGVRPENSEYWRDTVGPEAYNAIQLFMHFFPKTEIDGAGKLTIYMAKKPEDKPVYHYSDYFKISVYYAEEEIVRKREQQKPQERDEFYLTVIENVLTDIAKRAGKNEVIPLVEEAAAKVRETGFRLLLPVKKLSKQSPDKSYRAKTYRYLTPQGELSFVEITDRKKEKNRYVISNGYEAFSIEWRVQKCEWTEHRFVLKHRLDDVMAYIDADTKSMKSIANKNTTCVALDEIPE